MVQEHATISYKVIQLIGYTTRV